MHRFSFPPPFSAAELTLALYLQKDLQKESQRSDLLGSGRRGRGDPSLADEPYSDNDYDTRSRLLAGTETLADGEPTVFARLLQNGNGLTLGSGCQ